VFGVDIKREREVERGREGVETCYLKYVYIFSCMVQVLFGEGDSTFKKRMEKIIFLER
jgi:hypothetical protein